MHPRKSETAAAIALMLAGTTAASVQPRGGAVPFRSLRRLARGLRTRSARRGHPGGCRGRHGAAAVAAGPRPYGYGDGPGYGRPGGYYACPPGYHWGAGGRACYAN